MSFSGQEFSSILHPFNWLKERKNEESCHFNFKWGRKLLFKWRLPWLFTWKNLEGNPQSKSCWPLALFSPLSSKTSGDVQLKDDMEHTPNQLALMLICLYLSHNGDPQKRKGRDLAIHLDLSWEMTSVTLCTSFFPRTSPPPRPSCLSEWTSVMLPSGVRTTPPPNPLKMFVRLFLVNMSNLMSCEGQVLHSTMKNSTSFLCAYLHAYKSPG